MNIIEQQAIIESILEKVRNGELVPQPLNVYSNKQNEELEYFLRCSLLEWGQLYPIFITIVGLDTDNPIPYVIKGNKRLKIINELRKEGLLKFEPLIEYRELPNPPDSAGFYAASTFIKEDYTALQKGVYGAVHLYAGIRKQALSNQKYTSPEKPHIDTCKKVGKKVGCCDKIVRLGNKLIETDSWFYEFIWVERNTMYLDDARELVFLQDSAMKSDIIKMMKELYEEDKKAAVLEKDKYRTSDDDSECEDDKDLKKAFKKAGKSLYRRAKEKVLNITPEQAMKNAQNKVQSAYGGKMPTAEQVQQGKIQQEAFGKESEPPKYVLTYGDGPRKILVDFKISEILAQVIFQACEQEGISVTIESVYDLSQDVSKGVA